MPLAVPAIIAIAYSALSAPVAKRNNREYGTTGFLGPLPRRPLPAGAGSVATLGSDALEGGEDISL
jgi:hypothetical protein